MHRSSLIQISSVTIPVIAVGLMIALSRRPEPMAGAEAPRRESASGVAAVPTESQAIQRVTVPKRTVTPAEPSEFTGFSSDHPDVRLARVTALQSNPNLAPEVVAFLSRVLVDRTGERTVRNNAANALLNQPDPDPYLHRRFIAMIDDPEEEYAWREFAVQHLAVAHRTSADPEAIVHKLMRLARDGEKGIPGTAMLQLHRLDDDGAIVLDEGYTDLLLATIDDPAADLTTRMTVVGIAGERRERRALAPIRVMATTGIAALRRVSLAALGLMGEAGDLAILRQAAEAEDPGVRAAALAALSTAGAAHPDL